MYKNVKNAQIKKKPFKMFMFYFLLLRSFYIMNFMIFFLLKAITWSLNSVTLPRSNRNCGISPLGIAPILIKT